MKILVLIMLSIFFVSCASHHEAKNEVKSESAAVEPTVDPSVQYARAIAMINDNPDLENKDKKKLVEVVNTYATKGYEIRMKKSQYRSVLVTELLNSGAKKNPKADAAKKGLQKLNDESLKQLGVFIRDFKYYSGNTAANFEPTMKEVMRIQ